jgi:hypothetical protein
MSLHSTFSDFVKKSYRYVYQHRLSTPSIPTKRGSIFGLEILTSNNHTNGGDDHLTFVVDSMTHTCVRPVFVRECPPRVNTYATTRTRENRERHQINRLQHQPTAEHPLFEGNRSCHPRRGIDKATYWHKASGVPP